MILLHHLVLQASDVKIISITEVDVRRRRLLAKKLIVVYEVGAKDDGAALAISDKMNSDAFADTLRQKFLQPLEKPFLL